MLRPRNPRLFPAAKREREGRSAGRLRACGFRCGLGDLVDVSAGGARVVVKGKLRVEEGQSVTFTIESGSMPAEVQAKVVWIRKTGMRKHEVGLQFIDLTPEARQALMEVARAAPLNPTYYTTLSTLDE